MTPTPANDFGGESYVDHASDLAAAVIFKRLEALKGPWVHSENDFLPANVLCDYAGEMRFKQVLRDAVKEVLVNTICKKHDA